MIRALDDAAPEIAQACRELNLENECWQSGWVKKTYWKFGVGRVVFIKKNGTWEWEYPPAEVGGKGNSWGNTHIFDSAGVRRDLIEQLERKAVEQATKKR